MPLALPQGGSGPIVDALVLRAIGQRNGLAPEDCAVFLARLGCASRWSRIVAAGLAVAMVTAYEERHRFSLVGGNWTGGVLPLVSTRDRSRSSFRGRPGGLRVPPASRGSAWRGSRSSRLMDGCACGVPTASTSSAQANPGASAAT